MSDMTDLGIKRKDQYERSKPDTPKDYDNEVVYPSINACGKLAELMGAEDLEDGDVVEAPFKMKVRRKVSTDEDGKTHYDITFDLLEMGDMTDSSAPADEGNSSDEDSPAMAVLSGPNEDDDDGDGY